MELALIVSTLALATFVQGASIRQIVDPAQPSTILLYSLSTVAAHYSVHPLAKESHNHTIFICGPYGTIFFLRKDAMVFIQCQSPSNNKELKVFKKSLPEPHTQEFLFF